MKINRDPNQIVIDVNMYKSLMLIATQGSKSFNQVESEDLVIPDVAKQLKRIDNHVCKFNIEQYANRRLERRRVMLERASDRKELVDFMKAWLGKAMWQLHPTMTVNGKRVYYKVTPMCRAHNDKKLLAVRYAFGYRATASHRSLVAELPKDYYYSPLGCWAGMATFRPGDSWS